MTDKMVETMKERITEYSQCFSQSREEHNLHELNFGLGSPKTEVGFYDDFEPSYLTEPDSHDDMHSPMYLSLDLATEPTSLGDVTEDVLISAQPPAPFNDSFEFEVVEEF